MEKAEHSEPGFSRKKIVALSITLILIAAALFAGWYFFAKPWDIRQLASHVIGANTYSPGFSEDLAGKTVQVAGRLTNLTVMNTSSGPLSEIWLDNFYLLSLMYWSDFSDELGKDVSVDVSFEWSNCNNVTKVLSPQVFMSPGNGVLLSMGVTIEAVNSATGSYTTTAQLDDSTIRIKIEDTKYPSKFEKTNCSLRAGTRDGALEYIDLLDNFEDNPEIDKIENLSTSQAGQNSMLTYTDTNGNRILDGGDYVDIEGLTYPETESGANTYLLVIEREIDSHPQKNPMIVVYIVLFENGPIHILDGNAPYSRMNQEYTPDNGIKLTVAYVSREARLENFTRLVFWNVNGLFGQWEFRYDQSSLGSASYVNFSGVIGESGFRLDLFFSYMDSQNNQLFDIGDYLIILPTNGTHFLNDSELLTLFGPLADIDDVEDIMYLVELEYKYPEGAVLSEYFKPL